MGELKALAKLADRQLEFEAKVKVAEGELKKLHETLRTIAEVDLPEAMEAAGVEDFTLSDGSKVTIKTTYAANISEERRVNAIKWLINHDFGSIIRRDIAVQLGKGEDATAKKLMAFIVKTAPKAKSEDKEWVHHSTLRAFVKEQMEEGAFSQAACELFGVHRLVRAAIKVAR